MRKLGSSAILYSSVLTIGIGSVLLALCKKKFGPPGSPLLPLRTSKLCVLSSSRELTFVLTDLGVRDPLSEIPVDLLFLHIIAPATLTRLRPKRAMRYLLHKWWKMAARQLRLSSFMYGKRYDTEEQFDTRPWSARLRPSSTPNLEFRGALVRVPATDAMTMTSNQPVLIQVDEKGNPKTDQGKLVMQAQNEAVIRAGLTVADTFTITYIPPDFRTRVIYFTCYFWCFGTLLLLCCLAVPIYIGRGWVYATGYPPIHDAYTWTMGLYTLIAALFGWKEVKRLHRRGVPTPQRLLRNIVVNGGQLLYMVVMIGIVIPILIALVVDFHLVVPFRLWLGQIDKVEVHVAESWAIGLILIQMGTKVRVNGENELYQAWQRVCGLENYFPDTL